MEYMTMISDFAAIWAIVLTGLIGASGIFFSYSGWKGLALGLFVGTSLIAITPLIAPTFYSGLHINQEESLVLEPLSSFATNIINSIKPG